MDYKALATELFEYIVKSRKPALEERGHFSRGEMGILICLNFNKDGVTSGHLSEYLSVSTGRVATALKSLEKKGLVVRRTDVNDKRKVIVFITDSGKQFMIDRHKEGITWTEKVLRKLDEQDAKELIRLIKLIVSRS
ncbi:MarR family transcriptional regulator [Paenibacillus polymyxa]|uniref:MarR family winged helix-turn-helix transcriptional regulator n=1 Tax=Paenibacillus polymyxa TaxID=1406 RepID=UPI0004D96ACD|nr:MarR family transcriptional regulator [Paenibacillus polymyxa]KEO76062.1 transcriptional regulator [Paenibacillus polymyxa]MCH6190976.1 MarR family transcriptional regulator [Paenibacillus polymyxa]MDY8096318.1 MarR family transcriptional regulator [Paenibacillus polymyxa]WRL59585.1 MarR family transcriptional regulator [Paenibacillus polymyxa]